jgi:alkylhydroperoxidase family enzyme
MDTNTAGSSDAGASDQKIAALETFRSSDLFTPAERAALALAEAMSQTPADVSDEVFEGVRAHFSEPQLVELVATIAMENYRARFNRAFDVESQGLCRLRGITPAPPLRAMQER